jgi:hypothetical protein
METGRVGPLTSILVDGNGPEHIMKFGSRHRGIKARRIRESIPNHRFGIDQDNFLSLRSNGCYATEPINLVAKCNL